MRRALTFGWLAALTFVAAACEDRKLDPTVVLKPSLTVTPLGPVTLQDSQTARVTGFTINVDGPVVTYTSSSPSVATVNSSSGIVACVSSGQTLIMVRATGTDSGGAPVTLSSTVFFICSVTVTPPPPTGLLAVSGNLGFSHVVGTTTCPQGIGSFVVTNISNQTVIVNASSDTPAITLDASSATLAPGASRTFNASFNCATQSSFIAEITVTGTSGSTTETKKIVAAATITR